MGNVSLDVAGEGIREGHRQGPAILGLARAEIDPPFVTPALQAGADRQVSDIAGAW